MALTKWDERYLEIADSVALWSKDPSSKVGCCIIDEHNRPVSFGYNGFPKGMNDDPSRYEDREFKVAHVVHAEMNAVLSSARDLRGCTVYITHPPCTTCLSMMRQAMVSRIVCKDGGPAFRERWTAGTDIASTAKELGIEFWMVSNTV